MQEVIIKYNPYKLKTEMIIDGTNIATSKTLRGYYENLKSYLDSGIPLQTWIEPIPGTAWNGILAELKDDDFSDTIKFDFYGREIDYQDFKRTCESQNEQRKYPLTLDFVPHITLSDKKTLEVLDDVKNKLYSDEFKSIMASYSSDSELKKEYQSIEAKYKAAKNNEFRVVFAGLFSSGKSLIINTLIQHDILPVKDDTCTGKICRIIHDGDLPMNCSTLECFDINDVSIFPLESFDSDEKCNKRIDELTYMAENDDSAPNFDYFAVKVNLSHLYPNSEMTNEFVLTLIDTPGVNSAKTRGQAEINESEKNNLHRQLTLQAITDQSKDMVVLCFPFDEVEAESLGDFISTIYNTSENDRNSFCDRFLFVANKCDERKGGKSMEERKQLMVETLTDPRKLGLQSNEVRFVPQVFLSSALIEYVFQSLSKDFSSFDEETMGNFNSEYITFKSKLSGQYKANYMLSRLSGNPSYVKDEFENIYNEFLAKGQIDEAASIQSGIPCIARAITDYLERYAIPFKAAALLHTFDYFIEAVNDQLKEKSRIVTELESAQGENEQQGKGAKESQKAAQRRNEERQKIKKEISDAKASVDAISLENELFQISEDLQYEFDRNPTITNIHASGNIYYTLNEINATTDAVDNIFIGLCEKAEECFSDFSNKYQNEIKKVLEKLKRIGYNIDTCDTYIKCSTTLNSIKGWDIDTLRENVNKTKKRQLVEEVNTIKLETYKWWQLIKKFKQWRAPSTIPKEKDMYSAAPVYEYLSEKMVALKNFFISSEEEYKRDLAQIKKTVAEKLELIEREIDQDEQQIHSFAKELERIAGKSEELRTTIATIRGQVEFLENLKAKYNFGG